MFADFALFFVFFISLFFSLKAILFLLFCPNFNEAVPCLFFSMFPSTKSLTSKRWFHSVHGHPTMKKHARMVMLTRKSMKKWGEFTQFHEFTMKSMNKNLQVPSARPFFQHVPRFFPLFSHAVFPRSSLRFPRRSPWRWAKT